MNTDDITMNELSNDGSAIYIYKSSKIGTWTAYGRSGFALRVMALKVGIAHLVSFADRLKLPAVTVDEATYYNFTKVVQATNDENQSFHYINPLVFDEQAYGDWVCELTPRISVQTTATIDDMVPDMRFIRDNMTVFEHEIKRLIDLFVSAVVMLIFSPLFIVIFLAVKLEDGGPAIYRQERIGRFGRPFYILKFRSMRTDAEKFGPALSHQGGDNDPRLTKVGKFIRSHHLDELPQLWNVFRGDMAFVGHRPERKYFIDQIKQVDPRYDYLYQIRPGVTSYATLYNGYTDTIEKMVKRLEYDLYYLEHRSLWFDIKILWRTFTSIIFGKKI
ncbi:MAG: sugar transferase [Bacteroidales bacterium]|nr:sugar transferase [Bacteroidales bacterium]